MLLKAHEQGRDENTQEGYPTMEQMAEKKDANATLLVHL